MPFFFFISRYVHTFFSRARLWRIQLTRSSRWRFRFRPFRRRKIFGHRSFPSIPLLFTHFWFLRSIGIPLHTWLSPMFPFCLSLISHFISLSLSHSLRIRPFWLRSFPLPPTVPCFFPPGALADVSLVCSLSIMGCPSSPRPPLSFLAFSPSQPVDQVHASACFCSPHSPPRDFFATRTCWLIGWPHRSAFGFLWKFSHRVILGWKIF